MMAKRESYENEVLGGGAKMENGNGRKGSRQPRWQSVLGGDGGVDLRRRWRRGVKSDRK